MKYKEVSFSETFPMKDGHYQKIFVTAELEGSDDPRQALYECRKVVHNFFYESNAAAEKQAQEESSHNLTGNISDDIKSCKDLKVLATYKIMVKGKPDLQKIYDEKYLELSK